MGTDYFRKMYLGKTSHVEKMRSIPEKYYWNKILQTVPELAEFSSEDLFHLRDRARRQYELYLKQSEFKKPYLSDSYPEMEHDMLPPSRRKWPPFEYPNIGPCNPEVEDCGSGPINQVCDLDAPGTFCPGTDTEIAWTTSRNILYFQVTYQTDASTQVIATGSGTSGTFLITAGANEKFITIQAIMESAIPGESCSSNVNLTSGSNCCPEGATITFDDASTPDTVARSGTVTVYFIGSGTTGPYDWTVSGTGFTLGSAQTAGLSNTISASASACGACEFTITDQCGVTATAYIRCTTGVWCAWAYADGQCMCPGVADSVVTTTFYKYCSKYQQVMVRFQPATAGSSCAYNPLNGCTPATIATCQGYVDSGFSFCIDYAAMKPECIIYPLFSFYDNGAFPCMDGHNSCIYINVQTCLCNRSTSRLWEWKCAC